MCRSMLEITKKRKRMRQKVKICNSHTCRWYIYYNRSKLSLRRILYKFTLLKKIIKNLLKVIKLIISNQNIKTMK